MDIRRLQHIVDMKDELDELREKEGLGHDVEKLSRELTIMLRKELSPWGIN